MSSEVCPFCGKTYKRLKSHLPHCKAAASSQTPPTEHHVKPDQKTSSAQQVTGFSELAAKGKKSASPQSKKSTKVSAVSSSPPQSPSPAETLNGANTPSIPLPTKKKKKPKLSDQVKMASTPSSTASSPIPSLELSQSPSPSPSPSDSKRKRLRAPIAAAKSDQVTKGSPEGTTSASEGLPLGPTPFSTNPLRSRTTAQRETNIIPDNTSSTVLDTDTKPKDAPKKKASKTKRAAQSLSTTKDTDSDLNKSNAQLHVRDTFWVDNTEEIEDPSVNQISLNSGSVHQGRITIQDVKAMLGRAKTTAQSSTASFLSHAETTENLSSKTRLENDFSLLTDPAENQKDAVSCLVTKSLSDQLPSVTSQCTELQSVKKKSSKSLIPLQQDGPAQPAVTFPAPPLLCGHPSSQVRQAPPLPDTGSTTEGLSVGHHFTDLRSVPPLPYQFSNLHLFPPAAQTLQARADMLRADDVLKHGDRKQNTTRNPTEDAVAHRSLGQVTLRELPEWLACKSPSHPRDVVDMVQRGWQWYNRRYIDVKKGGIGGLAMLLAGYCVLSYTWNYPHIKRDRWRKYH